MIMPNEELPTPEQMAIAAKELADAKIDLERCKDNARSANSEQTRASNRVEKAAKELRELTDRLAPRLDTRVPNFPRG